MGAGKMLRAGTFVVEGVLSGFFLWFGLYIITRDLPFRNSRAHQSWWQRPALLAGVSAALLSWSCFGEAMQTIVSTKEAYIFWHRVTWWTIPIVVALWFWVVIRLISDEGGLQWSRLWEHVIPLSILFCAVFLSTVGTFTKLIFRYQDTYPQKTPLQSFFTPSTRYAPFLYIIVTGIMCICFVLLLRQCWKAKVDSWQRHVFKWLTLSSALFTLGVMISIVGYDYSQGRIPEQAGHFVGIVGLVFIGREVLRYNALIQNRVLAKDFKSSLIGVSAVAIFYGLIFQVVHWVCGYSLPPVGVLLSIYLPVLTHTPFELGSSVLDKLILPQWMVGYRHQLGQLGHEILTAPGPEQQKALEAAEKDFVMKIVPEAREAETQEKLREIIREEIDTIFHYTRFSDDRFMAKSRLHSLKIVQQEIRTFIEEGGLTEAILSERDRATALRNFLARYLDNRLCPQPEQDARKERWIEYIILRKRYVEGNSRDEVETHIGKNLGRRITGGTYTRRLKEGRKLLATLIWQAEIQSQE